MLTGVAVAVAIGLGACGDDDDEQAPSAEATTTVTETTTTEENGAESGKQTEDHGATTPSSTGEAADLPTCDQGVYPCVNADGSVTTGPPPEGAGPGAGGETADLPDCANAPPPCRADGVVVTP